MGLVSRYDHLKASGATDDEIAGLPTMARAANEFKVSLVEVAAAAREIGITSFDGSGRSDLDSNASINTGFAILGIREVLAARDGANRAFLKDQTSFSAASNLVLPSLTP
jgi:hypothetical protein